MHDKKTQVAINNALDREIEEVKKSNNQTKDDLISVQFNLKKEVNKLKSMGYLMIAIDLLVTVEQVDERIKILTKNKQ